MICAQCALSKCVREVLARILKHLRARNSHHKVMDSEADSDATVAHEPTSDGEMDTQTAGEKSPSFLNTQ